MKLRLRGNKRGQFIVIAALLIAIMIISAGAVLFSAVTYFKHERWEEYLIVVDGVEAGTSNVLELSLANYTQTFNSSVLKSNLNNWGGDVKKAYSGFGAILSHSLASGLYTAYGMNLSYTLGLARTWNQRISFSAANATASLNITSVGLTGYSFTSTVFLKMNIADALWYETKKTGQVTEGYVGVRVVIDMEGLTPVTGLQKSNFILFQVGGVNQTFSLNRYYDSQDHDDGDYPALNKFVYELRYFYSGQQTPPSVNVVIGVKDARNIKVTGQATNLSVIEA